MTPQGLAVLYLVLTILFCVAIFEITFIITRRWK